MTTRLSVQNLIRRFGGRAAVDGVSFEIEPGEILGVVGPSGSGKSILFDCIFGQIAPSAGEVRLDGRPVTGLRAREISRLGVARTFQRVQLFAELTVRDNLIVAGQERRGSLWSRLIGPPDAGLADTAAEMVTFFRLDGFAGQTAGNLGEGRQKLLDIAMAFMARPRLVVLDEPASGLDEAAREPLRERLRAINAQAGTTFVIIERDLDFAANIATHLLVFAEGRAVAAGDIESVRASGALEAYLGH